MSLLIILTELIGRVFFTYLHNTDFDYVFGQCCDDTHSAIDAFYSIITDCIANHVPLVVGTPRSKFHTYPLHIQRKLKRKATAWRVYKSFRTPESLERYKHISSCCRSLIYQYILHRENKIVNSSNVNKFYRYANKNFSVKSTIGPLKGPSGDLIIDPYSKAELLSKTFSDSFTIDNHHCPQLPKLVPDDTGISSIVFTPTLVRKSINHLRAKSKGGPDRIPPLFFKKCSLWLCQPLSYLFQSCFNAGFMPPEWSQAHITPIFKKGNPSDPLNYRPIALTCTMCKLMELIIKDQLLSYLLGKHLISRHQHAFIIKHSTTTNLLESLHDWSVALNNSNSVDVIYIDFRRAFDSIVYTKLLYKLQCYGVSGRLLAWISAFLTGRSQCVVVDNVHSSYVDVISGVPQGSVLGPILFILFVNDIDTVCHSSTKLKLYADDLKLYSVVESVSSVGCCDLQKSLDNVSHWANSWQFSINTTKTTVLNLTNTISSTTVTTYSVDDAVLSHSSIVSDLGILTDGRLLFKDHINSIVTKSSQRSGAIFRGFLSRNPSLMRKAFITYVRPILEYNSCIWNPSHKHLIDTIENVQRRYTKRIP